MSFAETRDQFFLIKRIRFVDETARRRAQMANYCTYSNGMVHPFKSSTCYVEVSSTVVLSLYSTLVLLVLYVK